MEILAEVRGAEIDAKLIVVVKIPKSRKIIANKSKEIMTICQPHHHTSFESKIYVHRKLEDIKD